MNTVSNSAVSGPDRVFAVESWNYKITLEHGVSGVLRHLADDLKTGDRELLGVILASGSDHIRALVEQVEANAEAHRSSKLTDMPHSSQSDPRIARLERGIRANYHKDADECCAAPALADVRAWQEIAERHYGFRGGCMGCTLKSPCPDRRLADAAIDRMNTLWGMGSGLT